MSAGRAAWGRAMRVMARGVAALLALAVVWALGERALAGQLDGWQRIGSALLTLLGAWLFACFALRGRIPAVQRAPPRGAESGGPPINTFAHRPAQRARPEDAR